MVDENPGSGAIATLACFVAMLSHADAAQPSAEDRYIAARDAAIERLQPIFDAGNADDAANKAEDAVRADLQAQMTAILGERKYPGFGAAKLNLDTLYKSDQGYGMLDGLRFDAEIGKTGEKAGENGADGKYVEPKAHIIVTTPTMFMRWLHAHKDWWDKGLKNVPQQIGAALKNESFYTQAISTDSAVVNFYRLPIVKPADAAFVHGILAGRTQSDIPDAADEVSLVSVKSASDRLEIACGSIDPEGGDRSLHRDPDRLQNVKRAAEGDDDFRFKKIDKKAYDKLGDLRQKGEDAYLRCFTQRAPQQPSFVEATR